MIPKLLEFVFRLGAKPRGPRVIIALVAIWFLPALAIGFFADDYFFLVALRNESARWQPWDLFAFIGSARARAFDLIDLGAAPWYAHEDLKLSFFRPLTSLTFVLDETLFGDHAALWHLHSIAWTSVFLAVAHWFLGIFVTGRRRILAFVFVAVSGKLALPTVWIANRNAFVALVPAFLAFGLHVNARERGRLGGVLIAFPLAIAALLGSEAGLGILVFFGAYELLAAPGARGRRLLHLAPYAVVGGLYLALYKHFGYGAAHSDVYLDPSGDATNYLQTAIPRLLLLLGSLFGPLPSESALVPFAIPSINALIGGVATLGFVAFFRRARASQSPDERRLVGALLAGAVLATLPALATMPMDRLLVGPLLGAAPALALLVEGAAQSSPSRDRRYARVLAFVLLVLSPLWGLVGTGSTLAQALKGRAAAHSLELAPEVAVVILPTAPDHIIPMYSTLQRRVEKLPDPPLHALSMAPVDHVLTRIDARSFELEPVGATYLSGTFDGLFRKRQDRFAPGVPVRNRFFSAEIVAMEGTLPKRVRFTFATELEDPKRSFQQWKDQRLQPLTMPAIGGTLTLVREPGPLGL